MAILESCLERARAGQGQFVTVAGDAGVGKSRLLHELGRRMAGDGITVLQGQCQGSGSNTPHLPFLEMLRRLLNLPEEVRSPHLPETAAANIRAIDAALETYLPFYLHLLSMQSEEHALPGHLQGEELQRAIRLALAALFTLSAEKQPTAIFLEDWQWVDESSHAALRYLVGVMAQNALLVIVNYRSDGGPDWDHHSHHTHLTLRSFDPGECEHIVRGALGAERLPEGLAVMIHERTGGNPFFIEEICLALLEQGAIEMRETREAVLTEALDSLVLPHTVQAVIRSRLDRLDEASREVVRLAAVIGRQFSSGILERLHPDPGRLESCLERLKSLELIQQVRLLPEAEFRFKHLLTQEVAYGTLRLQRRKELHRRAAEAIEARYADRPEEFAEGLGNHYRRGEVWDKAARHYLSAAEQAKAHYAYRNALGLCRQALEAAEKGEGLEAERADALVLLGDLRSLLGELEPANKQYEEALALTSDPARRRFIANKAHHPHTAVRDGARIVYYIHGSGKETLLFVNPIIYGLAIFQPILERLCQEFRIITVDLRGTGASDPIPPGFPLTGHVEDVRAVIEASGAAPVIGVGLSRGGMLLIRLTAAYPALLKKLVTIGAYLGSYDVEALRAVGLPAVSYGPEFPKAQEREDVERMLSIFIPTFFSESEPGTEPLVEQWKQALLGGSRDAFLNFFENDPTRFVAPLVEQVRVPTLVLHGTEDRLVPIEHSCYQAEHIPGALFYPFERCGHMPNMTAPAEFCGVLRQFVRAGTVPGSG
jgi:pimeloyl-ACP methyl ester carboxylesterase